MRGVVDGRALVRQAAAIFVCTAFVAAGCAPTAPSSPTAAATTPPVGQVSTTSSQATSTPTGAAQRGGTLVVAFNADPETLDPHISTALFAARALALMHNNLINRDYDGSFKPALADKWDLSPDGKVANVQLDPEHKSGNAAFNSAVLRRLKLTTDMEKPVPDNLKGDLVEKWACVPYKY